MAVLLFLCKPSRVAVATRIHRIFVYWYSPLCAFCLTLAYYELGSTVFMPNRGPTERRELYHPCTGKQQAHLVDHPPRNRVV